MLLDGDEEFFHLLIRKRTTVLKELAEGLSVKAAAEGRPNRSRTFASAEELQTF